VAERTLAAAAELLEDVVVVSDDEAFRSILLLMERAKVMAEPAASCTLAAAERVRERLGDQVVLLLCGGNLSFTDLMVWQERFDEPATA
jgi:threonine dehydratase